MDSLYSEMHDYAFCMNELPSRKHEGKFYYCGQRIARDKHVCSECAKLNKTISRLYIGLQKQTLQEK